MSRADGEERYLTASEVGSFTYCPEAWYLARLGYTPDAEARQRLGAGSRAHQRIGRTTEQLVSTDAFRRRLLAILIVLAALLLLANSTGLLDLGARAW